MTSIQIIILIILTISSVASIIWSIRELRKSPTMIDFNDNVETIFKPHLKDSIAIGIIAIHIAVIISTIVIKFLF